MLLTYYEKEFSNAKDQQNLEEMLFQIHLMLQQDPLDQQGIIRRCAQTVFEDFPEAEYTGEFPALNLQDVEQCELDLGRELHWVEERLCIVVLDRIRQVAQVLIDHDRLKKSVYQEPKSSASHSVHPVTNESLSSAPNSVKEDKHTSQPNESANKFTPWVWVGVGVTVLLGLWIWRN